MKRQSNPDYDIRPFQGFPKNLLQSSPQEIVDFFQKQYPNYFEEERMILITHFMIHKVHIEALSWLDLLPIENKIKRIMEYRYARDITSNEHEFIFLNSTFEKNHNKNYLITKN